MRHALPLRWIDGCRTRRTIELLTIVWLLAMTDLLFTIWANRFTPFTELNPFAGALLQSHRVLGLVLSKLLLTAVGTAIFWFLRKHGRTEFALWIVTLVYVGLMFRWSSYTSQILMLGVGSY